MKEVNEAIPSTMVLPGLRNCVEMLTHNTSLTGGEAVRVEATVMQQN